MDYSFLKTRKRGRVYKGVLGRPKKKTSQEEGPTQELIQKRQQLYEIRSANFPDPKKNADILSSLWGTSLGFLRLHGILGLQEYRAAEWFRSYMFSWRAYTRSPNYIVSKFSPVLNKQKAYQKEVLFLDPLEEERQEKVKEILYFVIKHIQKEDRFVWTVLNAVVINDELNEDVRIFLLRKAIQREEEIKSGQKAQNFILALKKGIAVIVEARKHFRGTNS